MKKTNLIFLQQSFGEDKVKIKQYLIDEQIDIVIVNNEEILCQDFHDNIDKYIPFQFTDLEQQFGTQG